MRWIRGSWQQDSLLPSFFDSADLPWMVSETSVDK